MSYLILPNGVVDFSAAVISFWFRTEQATIDAVKKAVAEGAGDPTMPLKNTIPLMVFGEMFKGYSTAALSGAEASYTTATMGYDGAGLGFYPLPIPPKKGTYKSSFTYGKVPKSDVVLNPSHIGIDCGDSDLPPSLRVRLQGKNLGDGKWAETTQKLTMSDGISVYAVNTTPPGGSPGPTDSAWDGTSCRSGTVYPSGTQVVTTTFTDVTADWIKGRGPDAIEIVHTLEIKPDEWHHILLSFDVDRKMSSEGATGIRAYQCAPGPKGGQAFTDTINGKSKVLSACKLWLALDDKNIIGKDLNGGILGMGDNDLVSVSTLHTANATNGVVTNKIWNSPDGVGDMIQKLEGTPGGLPTYSSRIEKLPSANQPFGIPCIPDLVDRIAHCEMAELQIFFNTTLDTGISEYRRAFIDYANKDENGAAIPNEDGTYTMIPVEMKAAEKLLAKKQEIILHGVSNWKTGKNTGSWGIDEEGKEIPEGQFQPTGKIEKYKPDPSLDKTVEPAV